MKLMSSGFLKPNKLPNASLLAIVLSAACWGLGTVMSKGTLDSLPPSLLLVVQMTASVIFLWAIVFFRSGQRISLAGMSRLRFRQLLRLGAPGLLEPGFAYTFGLSGLALTTASNAALIAAMEPVMVLGLSWLFLKEQIELSLVALSGLALVGASLTVGTEVGQSVYLGDGLIALGTLCAACYVVLSRRDVAQLDPLPLTATQQSLGLIWAFAVWQVSSIGLGADGLHISLSALVLVVLLAIATGIVQYALAFWLYLIALQGIPASIAAQFLALIPVFAVSGAYLFLGERLTVIQGLGMAVSLMALLGLTRLQAH